MKIVQSERTLLTLLSLKLMLILNLKKLSYAFRLKYPNIYDFFGSGEKHTALATIVWPFPVRNGFKDVCSTCSPHNLAAESFNLSIASYLKQTTKIWAFIPSLAVSDKLFFLLPSTNKAVQQITYRREIRRYAGARAENRLPPPPSWKLARFIVLYWTEPRKSIRNRSSSNISKLLIDGLVNWQLKLRLKLDSNFCVQGQKDCSGEVLAK